jgi:hypothetical protein
MGMSKITRLLLAGAVLALAACGPKTGETGAEAGKSADSAQSGGGALFPGASGASYSATYDIKGGKAETTGVIRSMTIFSIGNKRRVEIPSPMGPDLKMVQLIDPDTKTFVSFAVGPKAPKTATTMSADMIKNAEQYNPKVDPTYKPEKVGSDTVAGLGCTIWQLPAKEDGTPGLPMCITNDGIMLRTGTAEAPFIVATSVTKGPQDPTMFSIPAGYTVIDMGDCLAIMQQYGEAMRNGGAKPDSAKFAECQKKMMASMGAP